MTHGGKKHKKFNQHQQLVQRQQNSMMRIAAKGYAFSGPLPPPEALEKYNQALPGAAERIIKMAEEQSKHRQHLEKTVIESNAFVQKIGPFLGFVVAMTVVAGGFYLVAKGKDGYGIAAIIAALASLVGVFVYAKSKQKKGLRDKAEDFVKSQEALLKT